MTAAGSVYAQLLGPAFARLPRLVQRVHGAAGVRRVVGRCDIDRGAHPIARCIADLFGMPHPGREVPVAVTFRIDGRREIWQRDFDGEPVVTTHELGRGLRAGLVVERFWPFEFALRIPVRPDGLALEVAGTRLLGVPMPHWIDPRLQAHESAAGKWFRFDVRITLPLVGLLIHYRGKLTLAERWAVPGSAPAESAR